MEVQEVEVLIDKDGQVRVEVRGAKGTSCLDLTRDLEAALGGQIELREMKAETYEGDEQQLDDQLRLWSAGS